MRGGYREGAGRKPGFAAKAAEEARQVFAEKIFEEVGPIADALIAKAKAGDVKAAKELFDRAWGRPPQALEHFIERPTISQVLDALETKNEVSDVE